MSVAIPLVILAGLLLAGKKKSKSAPVSAPVPDGDGLDMVSREGPVGPSLEPGPLSYVPTPGPVSDGPVLDERPVTLSTPVADIPPAAGPTTPLETLVQPSTAAQQAAALPPGATVEEVSPATEDDEPEPAAGPTTPVQSVQPTQAAQEAASLPPGTTVEEVSTEAASPAVQSPVEAARALAAYASAALARRDGAALGLKRAPSPDVAALQAAMGDIAADGIYGPATRARGRALGVTMPVRK